MVLRSVDKFWQKLIYMQEGIASCIAAVIHILLLVDFPRKR